MGGGVELGRPMRGSQGGLGSAPVQLNRGGTVPRRTDIYGQDHMLAYIRPDEAALLKGLGGMGTPGPGGIPQYGFWDSVKSFFSGGGGGSSGGGSSGGGGGGGSSSSSSSSSTSSKTKTNQDRINEIYANSSDPWGTDGAELNKLVKDRDATYVGSADSGANTSWADTAASDPVSMLPGGGGAATGSGGGYDDFVSTYDFQKSASDSDPYGTSTASGVITSNGVGADINTDTGDVTLYNPGKTGGVTIDPMFNFGTGSSTLDLSNIDFSSFLPDIPTGATTVPTGSSGYPSLDAIATGASVKDELDAFGGAGPDINPDEMFTTDYYSSGYGAGDYDYTTGGGDVDIPTGSSGYPSLDAYVDTYVDPVDTGGGDGGGTTTTPVVTPEPEPEPAPVYYDMFGGEHDTQEAADQFDAVYSAAIEQPVVGGGRDFDVDMDPFVGETSRVTADDYESGVGNTTYFTEGDGSLTISDERDPYLESLIETGDAGSIISAGDVLADDKVGNIADEIIYDEFGNVLGEDLIPASDLLDVDLGINLESPEDFRRTEAGLAGIDYDTGEFIGGDADVDRVAFETDYGGRDFRDVAPDTSSLITNTIKAFEGYSDDVYFDVNAPRAGYGSDTKTDPITGEVTKIEPGMTVTREEAEADLNRRLTTEFIPSVVDAVGADTFYAMDPATQAALTSIAYNYGAGWADRLPSLAAAAKTGDKDLIADAIAARADDNDGINSNRRLAEAEMVRSGVGIDSDITSTVLGSIETSPRVSADEIAEITNQLEDQIDPTLFEEFMGIAVSAGVPYIGSYLADKMKDMGKEQREALVRQHLNAIERGATPIYDDEGNYAGFDMSTMGTFAEEVLSADDISAFLPPTGGMSEEEIARRADADGNGFVDYEEFIDVFEAQDKAADLDPDGMSTENGFIVTSTDEDGNKIETEFFVNADGTVTEVGKSGDAEIVDFDRGGGQEVDDAVKELLGITDDVLDDTSSDSCPEGYFLDPVTQECVPLTGVGEVDDATAEDISLSLSKIDRPTGGGVTPTPTTPTLGTPLAIRKPKQFAAGGAVTPNIDRFLQSLGA